MPEAESRFNASLVGYRPITTLGRKKLSEKKDDLNTKNYFFWGRWKETILANSPWRFFKDSYIFKELGLDKIIKAEFIILDGYLYQEQKDIDIISVKINSAFNKKDDWFEKIIPICEREAVKMEALIGKEDLEAFLIQWREVCAASFLVHYSDTGLQKPLQDFCARKGIKIEDLVSAMHPIKLTPIMQYTEELRRLNKHNVAAFVVKYAWVGTKFFNGECLDEDNALKDAESINEQSPITVKKSFVDDPEIQDVIKLGSILAFHRSNLFEMANRVAYYYRPYISKLTKKYGLSNEQINRLTINELLTLKKSGVLPSDFYNRNEKYGFECIDGVQSIINDPLVIDNKLAELQTNLEDDNIIKGLIAYKGYAKGIVCIIEDTKDIPKINEGDILVAPETSPDFIFAMHKAAAIVTNQGGITSHAAITARELHKPCVIGTKIATKMLKDGDLVEVDAINGLVKLIERKNE